MGELEKSDGTPIDENDDGGLLGGSGNFGMSALDLEAGTYYLKVTGAAQATGTYEVRAQVDNDTNFRDSFARVIEPGGIVGGIAHTIIGFDWFQFTLTEAADVAIYSSGGVNGMVARLKDSNKRDVVANDDGLLPLRPRHFLIRRQLAAGLYYLVVHNEASLPRMSGPTGFTWTS